MRRAKKSIESEKNRKTNSEYEKNYPNQTPTTNLTEPRKVQQREILQFYFSYFQKNKK